MAVPALLAEALSTRKRFNVGLFRQLSQLLRLRWSGNRLDPWEYYFFQVFLDRYPMVVKRNFIGWRREIELDRLLNTGSARDIANDKLEFYALMHRHGAPLPRPVAVYHPDGRGLSGTTQLIDSGSVACYLTDRSIYPLFVKPVRGARGLGANAIRGISADGNQLKLFSGRQVAVQDFVASLSTRAQHGYLFQELLQPHAKTSAACGKRLTSVRCVVLLKENGPTILSAVWRIPTGTNVTDNFSVGLSGNLVAGIDLASGRVTNVVQGAGWENRPVDRHPDTGGELRAFKLPAWPETQELCMHHAKLFPELRLQHWDIALADRGPIILELNVEGGLRTHQTVAPGPVGFPVELGR